MNEHENVKEFFNSNVADYESKHYQHAVRSFMTVRQMRVLEFVDDLGLPKGSRALDAGCGPGYLLEALAGRGLQVSGIDAAEGMIASSRERLSAAKPEFPFELRLGDIERLPYSDGSFDLVCSTGVIEYLMGDTLVLREFGRVLRPNGHLVLPVTNLWSPVNYLDFLVEFLKRRDSFRRAFNSVWTRFGFGPLLPRHFTVRRHRPAALRRALAHAGFEVQDDIYYHFLPWPRPFDRIFPRATASLETRMERYGRSFLGPLAEGYLVRARRRLTPVDLSP